MKILAVDLGDMRSGLAISDANEILASPIGTITEPNREILLQRILDVIKENNAGKIVLGLPRNMDGSEGDSAKKAREFGANLQNSSGLEVVFQDERGTTLEASGYLNVSDVRGKKRKKVIDSVAAVIILQNYLDSKK